MKRTCKVCKLGQELDRFPRRRAYHLHTCKLCHEEVRKPRVRKPLTPEQRAERAERRRERYHELKRNLGLTGRQAARFR